MVKGGQEWSRGDRGWSKGVRGQPRGVRVDKERVKGRSRDGQGLVRCPSRGAGSGVVNGESGSSGAVQKG